MRLVQLRRVSKVVDDYKRLVQFLHFQLLGRLRDLALLLDDTPQRLLLDGDPAVVYVDTRAEDVNSLKDAAILLQNQGDQGHFCPILMDRGRCPCTVPGAPRGQRAATAILCRRKQLDLPHLRYLPNLKPGSRAASLGARLCVTTRFQSFLKKTRGNPAPTPGLSGAILCPRQD